MITTILNGYKRPHFLNEQVNAIENQTIKSKEIMLWQNNNSDIFDKNITNNLTTSIVNKNLGVWARFTYALNAKTEYICIFDDDTIPGTMWYENCLNTIEEYNGLLGGIGVIFNSNENYFPIERVGWANPNETTKEVDIVGHSWFFKKEWLTAFWRELPPNGYEIVGEDMHFSYMLQKYLGLKTYVPPHPINNKEMWSSLKGWEMGTEKNALSLNPNNMELMNDYYKKIIKEGFKRIKH